MKLGGSPGAAASSQSPPPEEVRQGLDQFFGWVAQLGGQQHARARRELDAGRRLVDREHRRELLGRLGRLVAADQPLLDRERELAHELVLGEAVGRSRRFRIEAATAKARSTSPALAKALISELTVCVSGGTPRFQPIVVISEEEGEERKALDGAAAAGRVKREPAAGASTATATPRMHEASHDADDATPAATLAQPGESAELQGCASPPER